MDLQRNDTNLYPKVIVDRNGIVMPNKFGALRTNGVSKFDGCDLGGPVVRQFVHTVVCD